MASSDLGADLAAGGAPIFRCRSKQVLNMKQTIKNCALLLSSVALLLTIALSGKAGGQSPGFSEAPAGFDNESNGFADAATHSADQDVFEERDTIEKGLGPVYNAQSCAECHQNPRTGGISQVTVLRAGHLDRRGNFVDAPGGSLINERAIDASIQESVGDTENVRTFRSSLNTLGDGYIEAVDDAYLASLPLQQSRQSRGLIVGQINWVSVLENPGMLRVGRFGWKDQHASLLSFAGDAYLNEIGITNRLFPTENTSLGTNVEYLNQENNVPALQDPADPVTGLADIDSQARFMRASKVPPRADTIANAADVQAGEQLFNNIGCTICHIPTIQTASAAKLMQSKWINGLTANQAAVLGNKTIHPYSDFLLHDINTGDGIVQNGGQSSAFKMRTAPLWGLRTHDRFLHDGQVTSLLDAINRHSGEAIVVARNFRALTPADQRRVIAFLKSL